MKSVSFLAILMVVTFNLVVAQSKPEECEVCISVVDKLKKLLESDDKKNNPQHIEKVFKEFCKGTKSKENRFCYYLGGLEESATGILKELSQPLSVPLPSQVICKKLNAKDSQICGLKYDKQIDLDKVDLKKLKVKDLKKVLNDWDETCDGCIEKSDYISRIEELKPKYYRKPKTEL